MNHVIMLEFPSLKVTRTHKHTFRALALHNDSKGPHCYIEEPALRRCYELCRSILENEEKIKSNGFVKLNTGTAFVNSFEYHWGICSNSNLSMLPTKFVANMFKFWYSQTGRQGELHLTAPIEGNTLDYEIAAKNHTLWQNEDRWSLLKCVLYKLGQALSVIDEFHAANPIPTINTSLFGDEDAKTKEHQT